MNTMTTAEAMAMFAAMPDTDKAAYDEILTAGQPIWVPQAGPQYAAYHSKADILFYGGAAGGGKTDLLMGLSATTQEHSIIFRREAVQLIGIEERMTSIVGTRDGYNSTTGVWRLPGNKVMELVLRDMRALNDEHITRLDFNTAYRHWAHCAQLEALTNFHK